jgi:trk system potassium uptake protein TrkA
MHIVIAGMGEVGGFVARVLIEDGHDVTIVDADATALSRAEETFDARTVCGHAGSPDVLRRAGVPRCDLFVAVTDHCELNIVCAITARQLGAKRTIARVLDPAYFETPRGMTPNLLGIDVVINPLFQIAAEIRRLVRSRAAVAIQDFADHQIEMIQLPIEMGSPLVGRALRDLQLPHQSIVAGIERAERFLIPGGNDVLLAGDRVFVVGQTAHILEVESRFMKRRVRGGRKAIIIGGGLVGENLARSLESDGFDVVLIESDGRRCKELASRLHRTVVLQADGTNAAILEEEGVAQADVFIAVSDEDELNLMASILARDLGCRRSVALVHRTDYAHVCARVGIDTTLSPRMTVAQQVLRYVREGEVVSVSPVMEGVAEFVELVVPRESRVCGRALHAAQIPRGALVCAVLTADGAIVPRGDHVFQAGELVVLLLLNEVRPQVERLFRKASFAVQT